MGLIGQDLDGLQKTKRLVVTLQDVTPLLLSVVILIFRAAIETSGELVLVPRDHLSDIKVVSVVALPCCDVALIRRQRLHLVTVSVALEFYAILA